MLAGRLFATSWAGLGLTVGMALGLLVPGGAHASGAVPGEDPMVRAHAHNSYEHSAAPVQDALGHRFGSVEVDVWQHGDGSLQVHHYPDSPPVGTLRDLYLQPLHEWIDSHGGTVYPDRPQPLQLLVDIKTCPASGAPAWDPLACPHQSDAATVWAAIEQQLAPYRGELSRYAAGTVEPGPVEVVVTGNVPLAAMRAASSRLSFANLAELDTGLPTSLAPLVNIRYDVKAGDTCRLRTGQQLRELADRAHREGRRIRFWWNVPCGTEPDPPRLRDIWRDMWDAGVDHISGDSIEQLAAHLPVLAGTPTATASG